MSIDPMAIQRLFSKKQGPIRSDLINLPLYGKFLFKDTLMRTLDKHQNKCHTTANNKSYQG